MKNNWKTSDNQQTKTKKPANRKLTRGAMSLLLTVLFIAAVVLVNIVLSVITNTHPLYIDVTENASYQLQKETKEYLDEIKDPVSAHIFRYLQVYF